jgi:hypothetical protein
MEPTISNNIFVVFNQKETARITEKILEINPIRVYYFRFFNDRTGRDDEFIEYYHQNIETIRAGLPNCDIIQEGLNYVDYYAVVQRLSRIIKAESREMANTVYINIGVGSKFTAIASIDACRLWGARGLYVYSDQYQDEEGVPMHTGPMITFEVPQFNFQKPESHLIDALKVAGELADHDALGRQKNFVYKAEWMDELGRRDILADEGTSNKRQMEMLNRFVKPLIKIGCITEETVGRQKKYWLTPNGRAYCQIFKYLY